MYAIGRLQVRARADITINRIPIGANSSFLHLIMSLWSAEVIVGEADIIESGCRNYNKPCVFSNVFESTSWDKFSDFTSEHSNIAIFETSEVAAFCSIVVKQHGKPGEVSASYKKSKPNLTTVKVVKLLGTDTLFDLIQQGKEAGVGEVWRACL